MTHPTSPPPPEPPAPRHERSSPIDAVYQAAILRARLDGMTRELLDLRAIVQTSARLPQRRRATHHDRSVLLLEHVAAFIAGLAATAIVAPEPGDTRAIDVVTESLRFAVSLYRNDVPGLDRRDTSLERVLLSHRLVTDERGTITWYADEELEAEAASEVASRKGSRPGGHG